VSSDVVSIRQIVERLFVCIGGSPHTDWALEAGVVRDEAGYLVTGPDLHFEGKSSNGGWPLDRSPYYPYYL